MEACKDKPPLKSFASLTISAIEVQARLSELNVEKSMGPDQIPACVLKNCKHELATPLALLFNKSIEESALPQDWRDADVLPILKSGNKLECNNYRPISLTSIVVKVLEQIIQLKL